MTVDLLLSDRTRPLHIVHISKLGFLLILSKYCKKSFFLNIASFYRMFLSTHLWLSNLFLSWRTIKSWEILCRVCWEMRKVACLIQLLETDPYVQWIFVNHCCQFRPGFRPVAPKSSATSGKNSANASQKIVPKHPIGPFILKWKFSEGNIVVENFFFHFW